MGDEPKVKGASIIRPVETIRELIAKGEASELSLQVRLSAETFALLDSKVEPSLWYPLHVSDELSRVLVDLVGDGNPDYLRTMGGDTLRYMLERDTFRSFIEGAMAQKGREGANLVGLAGLVYSFGVWRYEGEDLRDFTVTIDEATPLPDNASQTIVGFIQALVAHCTGDQLDVEPSRPTRDRVVFRATLAGAPG